MSWEFLKTLSWRSGSRRLPLCAGSGLARVPGGFWVIADDLNHVVFIPDRGAGAGKRLFPGSLPSDAKARKRVKKDLESLIDLGGGKLIAFPSGSKDRRCRGSVITLDARGKFKKAKELDFRPLMNTLDAAIPGLNIEGGFVKKKRLVLLQRGNGRAGVNALVKIRLSAFREGLKGEWRNLQLKILRVRLPALGGVPLTFTDGFFLDGASYFSAAAEAGKDTVRDGEVKGSVVGVLPKGAPAVVLARLAGEKIEGIAPGRVKDGLLEIFAVTDADDPSRASRLMRTWVKKAN